MNKIFEPKLFTLLKSGISKEQLISDIFAGIVVGIVALPLSIAFAVASGLSPEKGLITAIIAGFLISALGGSRVQIGGPTGAFVVIIYAIVEQYGIDGLIISTVMSGIILIAFGFLRLGGLLKYFPHPLIVGFTSGIAVIIFSTQIKDALGLNIEKLPSEFFQKWVVYFSNITQTNISALAITITTILITIYSRKITTRIPGSFIAIIFITLFVQVANIPVTTIESFFGEIPNDINFTLPAFDINNLHIYIAPALTIALLGGVESLLSAVVSDGMISTNHRSNTELIAQGIANVVTPFFGGIPATGAIARTATNVKNGGRTPIAGIVHAITLLLIMLIFASYAKLIPMACLAGILIVVAYNMSEWRSFMAILRGSHFDIIVLLSTFFLTVFVDLTAAIQIGVVLSSLLFMKRMADIGIKTPCQLDSDILEDYSDLPEGISIYEISGPLFFASAKQYSGVIKEIGLKSRVLIIRMRHVPFVDSTALHNFEEMIKTLQKSDVKLLLSGVNKSVLEDLKKHELTLLIGESNILDSFEKAVIHAKNIIS
ncbi:MAG: sodium-independent anion transporter [Sulfurimonas sp. RIFOXYD12_FULL_33_39]|uniref:SulP family inorganic anion transporter n=1 Tax=unclassified Sulfurimonas TaxID=2623549 RepID=UPI0008B1EC1D|nr:MULTISPECIES: SulP family inorganic anion transporter [unclassified Sulfurimonas]OHE05944.1 MAG: sodium-independent anion transporter [Sulfurimonas sp. RIFCSPLOWO2_12_FULL_34_6]OHE09006.1 MAG: sodium-independent anion transporter [Sulfurimonas sp. RIFOXYD12_FULL_33_39]OHE14316.1 MAG: sodium-independent anion transporter [Sulfurimonas sp. RIFOXYD2_FULL_34_21]DAB27716.1 MAG TPA: sodium-independent anion transporter [Sulfurimonas sp. UBA10385]